MTAWQCGGQGFESPQLHPIDEALTADNAGQGLSRSGAPAILVRKKSA
jgi:hypothetical protein